jgi:hypothetical protein
MDTLYNVLSSTFTTNIHVNVFSFELSNNNRIGEECEIRRFPNPYIYYGEYDKVLKYPG